MSMSHLYHAFQVAPDMSTLRRLYFSVGMSRNLNCSSYRSDRVNLVPCWRQSRDIPNRLEIPYAIVTVLAISNISLSTQRNNPLIIPNHHPIYFIGLIHNVHLGILVYHSLSRRYIYLLSPSLLCVGFHACLMGCSSCPFYIDL